MATNIDHLTPIEPLFAGEVALAITESGMSREQANEIANELLPKYEDKIKGDPTLNVGQKYQDLYDMETLKPSSEYVDFYQEIKKEMGKMGIQFRYNFLSQR